MLKTPASINKALTENETEKERGSTPANTTDQAQNDANSSEKSVQGGRMPVSLKEIEGDFKKLLDTLWSFKDVILEFQDGLRKHATESTNEIAMQIEAVAKQMEILAENMCLKKDIVERINAGKDINTKIGGTVEKMISRMGAADTYLAVADKISLLVKTYGDTIEKVSLLESNFKTFFRTQKSVEERKEEQRSSAALPGSSAIIRSTELERQKIAREIHDGPAQAIANIIFRLDIVHKTMAQKPEAVPDEMAKVKEIAQGALNEIRHFIFDLRPMTLQDLGLTATLKKIIQTNSTMTETKIDLLIEGDERSLDPAVELAIFRIAQESLNNIKKHAKADHAWVHLRYLEDRVILIVEDDGSGFDLKARKEKSIDQYQSFGLLGMQERADDVMGTLQIASQPLRGTKIIFTVPTK